jgi:hypothetical protein
MSTPNVTLPHWHDPEYFIAISFALVMAGLVPAIHAFVAAKQGVDARHKAGMTVWNCLSQT